MNRGETRRNILGNCPKEFTDMLSSYIDDIENELGNILHSFQIRSLGDLDKITTAYDEIESLKDSLC